MRFLVIIAILYLAYLALKVWIRRNVIGPTSAPRGPAEQIDDLMVQDPVCGIYFPRKSGVPLNIDGKTLLFCGEECKEKYLAERAGKQ
jgi:uncharacterized protein